ncbi:elongation of very long chain fatty acids protein AAEL008004-like isoform X1 [Schistocerca gregaria]|uniref:elongation of very long chain fatty acids protein AAEL008004-like isoform X1 n=1 Tax=Schistocerca gregaria TaxID=7010 RepID=UPI00211E9A5F|nr:elongation of very long chain fatty acids protein AAEL008004-like isoform X1 [Schistocerca gregaria]XP_049847251.1 elongation of very long chain fatty acids protein AAEL008004-like isoform X1 [Schistocerca gregaria]
MTQLVQDLVHGYRDIMDNRSDPRVNHWPMMSSPMPTLIICIIYAYCSKVVGPKLMENRKPFQLRNVLIVYNLLQTLFSSWIFYEYLQSGWAGHYSFRCQPVDYSYSPMGLRMANTCWWYYISKFTEFFDTLFFILRKKNKQVSNLHVIHHGCMPMSVWMGLKFAPGGHSTFFALLNTFVHIVMYFYYMVSAMGPEYQKYIWWKKYLTTMQMVQFVLIFAHQFQLLFIDCNYPKAFMVWIGLHGVMFLFLFSDFYRASYTKKVKDENSGACMPLDDQKKNTDSSANGIAVNGNAQQISDYANEYSKAYSNCYSNGVNNGYMSTAKQSLTQRAQKGK